MSSIKCFCRPGSEPKNWPAINGETNDGYIDKDQFCPECGFLGWETREWNKNHRWRKGRRMKAAYRNSFWNKVEELEKQEV